MSTTNDLPKSRELAEKHKGRADDCGALARQIISEMDADQQAPAAEPGMVLVPRVSLQSWLAAFDEEAAAYYPDAIEHVSRSGDEIRAVLADRWKLRSTTYAGIGAAMADQWGSRLVEQLEIAA